MKSFITFNVFFYITVQMVFAADPDIVEKCQKETKFEGTPDKIKYDGEVSKEAKCFIACIIESYDILTKEGTYDKEVAIKVAEKKYSDNPELKEKVLKAIDFCVKNVKQDPTDKCETAYNMVKCKIEKTKAA